MITVNNNNREKILENNNDNVKQDGGLQEEVESLNEEFKYSVIQEAKNSSPTKFYFTFNILIITTISFILLLFK